MTQLGRKDILDALVNALEPLDYVHAFWEVAGSISEDEIKNKLNQ